MKKLINFLKERSWRLPLLLATIFFVASFLTLRDYGISWDETIHFSRGQAYLYYFLTGKTNYNDLPSYNLQGTFGKPQNIPTPRRSFYQLNDFHNGDYYINAVGHPPINDILSALGNYVFFQKFGVLDDISAHHLFNIIASSILVFVVVMFAKETFGTFASVISFLVLCTYPLFWAESHFNIKDPPEAAFFAGFIWTFYKSLKNFSVKWLAFSILFFSLGMGTKFNILFAIPIVVVYLLYRYQKNILKTISSMPKVYIILLILAPIISLVFLTISWPFLWHDWLGNLVKVIDYYRNVGTSVNYQPQNYYFAGFNTSPILWIIFTTPPITLVLFCVGVISAILTRKKKASVSLLWLFWFLIPILRVIIPGTSIYGGVRQIMEYLPAMALLAGLGAYQISKWFSKGRIISLFLILIFIWPISILFKLHPNENVYFNFLIGGLKGAQSKNFPSWGNSFGNAYLQGINWINVNAEKGAKLSLIQGTRLNVPPILVRKDIDFSGIHWSGINRGGEYLMELTFNDTTKEFHYAWEYVDKFLDPVYELKVDGVSILKIWKNDFDHTKKEYQFTESTYQSPLIIKKNANLLTVDLNKETRLSRIKLIFTPFKDCFPITTSFVEISSDGTNWLREKDWIPYPQVGLKSNSEKGQIEFYIAGEKARYIRFWLDNVDSCALNKPNISIMIIE